MLRLTALALAWLAGLALLHQFERVPGGDVAVTLATVLALCAGVAWRVARVGLRSPRKWPWLLCWVFLAAWRADLRLAQDLPPAWEARDIELTGRIDSAARGGGGRAGAGVALSVRGGAKQRPCHPDAADALSYAAPGSPALKLTAGETWRFTVRLKRLHGLANPGGFDAELWLLSKACAPPAAPGSAVQSVWRLRLGGR